MGRGSGREVVAEVKLEGEVEREVEKVVVVVTEKNEEVVVMGKRRVW